MGTDRNQSLDEARRSWLGKRPWLADLAVVLAVFVYNLPLTTEYHRDGPWFLAGVLAVSVALCVPYLFRRRYPLAVFGIILIAATSQLLLGVALLAANVMLAFALYNVASRFRWTVAGPAAGAVVTWLAFAVTPLLRVGHMNIGDVGVLVLVVVWAWTWGTLVRTRRGHLEGLRERARRLERERETQAKLAAAEERARIARELHDIVSHSLSVVVVMAEGAASKVDSEPQRAKTAITQVRDTGRTALVEMRRMLGVLRDGEPGSRTPQPGLAQLEDLVEESRETGLPVTMTVRGEPVEVPASTGLVIYRVVQEALTNVRKHAGQPGLVEVWLRYRDTELEIRVTDDGRGFGDHAEDDGGGHGLVGMRERVAAHGGTLRAGMRPSGGFEVAAVVPTGGMR